ncbi:MAG: L,D-transpeptidase family protein [Anaerolineales bacterium]
MKNTELPDIIKAKQAIRNGDKKTARSIAHQILANDPRNEDAWLILAAIAPPEIAVSYLKKVLEINPHNTTALRGLEYYLNQAAPAKPISSTPVTPPVKPQRLYTVKKRQILFPWFVLLIGILIVILTISQFSSSFAYPFIQVAPTLVQTDTPLVPQNTPTPTYTLTPTATPTPTSTSTPLPTETPTITPTLEPTATATVTANVSSKPKDKKKKQPVNSTNTKNKSTYSLPIISPPKGIKPNEHWVEVDLSSQSSAAYIGSTRVRTFIVSTGTWLHPTVTGTFKIYVKYRYANMSGPGYFLPNVPYVMYFYQDYGLHGTYWHHNFGVPMSHGCVNYSIPDAAWLFDFVNVGTIVYIHP